MRVVSVDSQELMDENGAATNAIDGNATTFWHTEWYLRTAPLPHSLRSLLLDLGSLLEFQAAFFAVAPK